MEKIRIAIADDDAGMRMMVRKLIERADDYALVGEAENGEELLSTPDTDEELDEVYQLFMERFFQDDDEA